jgi:hypothetical protein
VSSPNQTEEKKTEIGKGLLPLFITCSKSTAIVAVAQRTDVVGDKIDLFKRDLSDRQGAGDTDISTRKATQGQPVRS